MTIQILPFIVLWLVGADSIRNGNRLEQTNGPFGTSIKSLWATPQGDMLAVVEREGLYRLADSEDRWSPISEAVLALRSVQALAVDSAGMWYVGGFGGLYRSSDRGLSWHRLDTDAMNLRDVLSLGVTPNGTIYAGSMENKVYQSTDNGETWTNVGPKLSYYSPVELLAVNSKGDIFFGRSTMEEMYRSTNNGKSWKKLDSPFGRAEAMVIDSRDAILLGSQQGVFRSTSNGERWDELGRNRVITGCLTLKSDGSILIGVEGGLQLLETSSRGRLLQTNDGGKTWTQLSSIHKPQALAVRSPETVFLGTDIGILRSTVDRKGWEWVNDGLLTPPVKSLLADTVGNIFAITNLGVFRSTNKGVRWTHTGIKEEDYNGFLVHPSGRVYAGSAMIADEFDIVRFVDPNARDSYKQLLDSTIHWTRLRFSSEIGSVSSGIIMSEDTILVGTYNEGRHGEQWGDGVFRSTDRGGTWASLGLRGPAIMSLVVSKTGVLFAAARDGIYRSEDYSGRWRKISAGNRKAYPSVCLDPIDGETLWLGTSKGLYRSTDHGIRWQIAGFEDVSIVHVSSDNRHRVLGVITGTYDYVKGSWTDTRVHCSVDGGKHWQELPIGPVSARPDHLVFDADGYTYIGTKNLGVLRSRKPVKPGAGNHRR